jgi:hypothetical protein
MSSPAAGWTRTTAVRRSHVRTPPEVAAKLRHQRTRRAANAFALTAIRETFEETGLIVARPADATVSAPKGWRPYYGELGAALHFNPRSQFIGRAITPPYRPKPLRCTVLHGRRGRSPHRRTPAGRWRRALRPAVGDAQRRSMDARPAPSVTRFMLGEIDERLPVPKDYKEGPPFLRWTRSMATTTDRL